MRLVLKWVVRLLLRPALSSWVPVAMQRLWGSAISIAVIGPRDARFEEKRVAGVPTLQVETSSSAPDCAVLFLHGGAYVAGGFGSHRKLAAAVSRAASAKVWLPDYRLAPEHPHPAALKDALAVYSSLLEQGQDPGKLSLVGDSAGGGLSMALAMAIRDAGLPLPNRIALMSPWVDLGLGGQSMITHEGRDPMLKPAWLRWASELYRGGASATQPGCSPLFGDLSGLPPVLIQAGSEEVLLSDSLRLHETLKAAGVDVTLQQAHGLWHVYQLHWGLLQEATQAVEEIGQFILASPDAVRNLQPAS